MHNHMLLLWGNNKLFILCVAVIPDKNNLCFVIDVVSVCPVTVATHPLQQLQRARTFFVRPLSDGRISFCVRARVEEVHGGKASFTFLFFLYQLCFCEKQCVTLSAIRSLIRQFYCQVLTLNQIHVKRRMSTNAEKRITFHVQ